MAIWATVLAFGSGVLGASGALPESPGAQRELQVELVERASCTKDDAVYAALRARLPRYSLIIEPAAPERPLVRLSFRNQGGGIAVAILVRNASGKETRRQLEARDCAEAELAASFIAALALDAAGAANRPSATNRPSAAEPKQNPAPSPTERRPSAEETGERSRSNEETLAEPPFAAAPPLITPKPTPLDPTRKPRTDLPAPPPAVKSLTGWLGVGGAALLGPGPDVLWGGFVAASLGSPTRGFWAPSVQLRARWAAGPAWQTAQGAAQFELGTVGLSLCPSHWEVGALGGHLCALAEGGYLRAMAFDTYAPVEAWRPWLSAGLGVDGQIRVAGPVHLLVNLEATAPLIRDSFFFDSGPLHRIPGVIGAAHLAFVIAFR